MVRVTIDKDDFDELREVMTFFNLRYQFGNCSVRWSQNRRGLHFRCFTPLTEEQSLLVRQVYEDDEVRVKLDSKMVDKARNVTFTPNWPWESFIYDVVKESYISFNRESVLVDN